MSSFTISVPISVDTFYRLGHLDQYAWDALSKKAEQMLQRSYLCFRPVATQFKEDRGKERESVRCHTKKCYFDMVVFALE